MKLIKKTNRWKLNNFKNKDKNKKKSKISENKNVIIYFNFIEYVNDITKKHQQEIIEEKIKQREKLYKAQAEKLLTMKNSEQQRLEKQAE